MIQTYKPNYLVDTARKVMKWRIQIDLISEDTAIQANNMIDRYSRESHEMADTDRTVRFGKKVEKWSCTTT